MKVAPWNWPLFPLLCIGLLHITTLAALAGLPWGCISVASLGVWLRFASRTSWEPLRAHNGRLRCWALRRYLFR